MLLARPQTATATDGIGADFEVEVEGESEVEEGGGAAGVAAAGERGVSCGVARVHGVAVAPWSFGPPSELGLRINANPSYRGWGIGRVLLQSEPRRSRAAVSR